MSDGYQVISLAEIEPVPYHGRDGQKLIAIQRLLDYRVAGINAWTGDPGEGLVPEHTEDSDNEELYVVVRGRARFTVDGVDVDAPAGTLLHLGPGERRVAVSEEAGTIVLAIGATIGEGYKPSGWTSFVVADALRREGRVDEGRTVAHELLELHGDYWGGPYNVACFEALAGDLDAAFRFLDQALRLDTQAARRLAREDSDLDALHDDPRWKRVVG